MLDGLCNSAARRETTRKALLRFGFRKLRNATQSTLATDDQVQSTLRVMAQEDTTGRASREHERPTTSGSQKRSFYADAKGPPSQEFVGAVSWSYKSGASAKAPEPRSLMAPSTSPRCGSSGGRSTVQSRGTRGGSSASGAANTPKMLPRLSTEWQFRPGTAPEVANREPLPEPPPGSDSLDIPPLRPDTAPEAMLPGVHGLSPSSRQGTGGGTGTLLGNSVASPALGRPPWRRGQSGAQAQSPRQQETTAMTEHFPDAPETPSSPRGVASRQRASGSASAADHPAAATPPATSVFARALGRAPNRSKQGASETPVQRKSTPRTGGRPPVSTH